MTTDEWKAILLKVEPNGRDWIVLGLADQMNRLADRSEERRVGKEC